MTQCSIESTYLIFVKRYRFLPYVKNMGKIVDKSANKSLSGKCSIKAFDHAKQWL